MLSLSVQTQSSFPLISPSLCTHVLLLFVDFQLCHQLLRYFFAFVTLTTSQYPITYQTHSHFLSLSLSLSLSYTNTHSYCLYYSPSLSLIAFNHSLSLSLFLMLSSHSFSVAYINFLPH